MGDPTAKATRPGWHEERTPAPAAPAPTRRQSHKAAGICGALSPHQCSLRGPAPILPSPAIFVGGPKLLPGSYAWLSPIPAQGRVKRRAGAQPGTRAGSFQQTQHKDYGPSSPCTRGCTATLWRGRMEDAGTKGRAVVSNAPQPACVNAARQSPCALHQAPFVLPIFCCAEQYLPGLAAPL